MLGTLRRLPHLLVDAVDADDEPFHRAILRIVRRDFHLVVRNGVTRLNPEIHKIGRLRLQMLQNDGPVRLHVEFPAVGFMDRVFGKQPEALP